MDNERKLKPLPLCSFDFPGMMEDGMMYVDKTEYVYKLAHSPEYKFAFLARPRRFGKSMFLSTLGAYYEGRKELFEGLKIMELEKEWKKYCVLKFDFSECINSESLKENIEFSLKWYEKKLLGNTNEWKTIGSRLGELMCEISDGGTKRNIVMLFDEYDRPLTKNLFNENEKEKVRNIFGCFFPVVKKYERAVKQLVLTGVAKFMGMNLFSTLNNVQSIGALKEFDAVCGFTHEELRGQLMPYVERIAKEEDMDTEEMIQKLIQRYDSYYFNYKMEHPMFNPYSLANCLHKTMTDNYWMNTGGTKTVYDVLKMRKNANWDLNNIEMNREKADNADFDENDIDLVLLQSGYLTIKEYDKKRDVYKLGIPNKEIEEAIIKMLVPILKEEEKYQPYDTLDKMKWALMEGDVKKAMMELKASVAGIGYGTEKADNMREDRFKFLVRIMFMYCGYKVQWERQVSGGTIDLICENKDRVFVIETKLTSRGGVEEAVAQIKKKGYAEMFETEEREVYAVALEFEAEKRVMEKYKVIRIEGGEMKVVAEE